MRNPPLRWTPELHSQLCSLIGQGRRYPEIANIMGLTYNQVMGHWKRKKLVYPANRSSWWTPERHAMLCALVDEGLPTSEIGRRMGVTKNTIIGRCDRKEIYLGRYAGPTAMERLDAINARMDDLFEWQNMIFGSRSVSYRPLPQIKSMAGRLGARQAGGFGSHVSWDRKNGFRAVQAPTETSR